MIENTEIIRGKSKYCDKKIHENSANGSKATSKSEQAKRKGVKLNGCKTARLCARARLSFKYLPHNITPYPSEHNGAKNIVFFLWSARMERRETFTRTLTSSTEFGALRFQI